MYNVLSILVKNKLKEVMIELYFKIFPLHMMTEKDLLQLDINNNNSIS